MCSQTRNEVAHAAMLRLCAHGCTPAHLLATDVLKQVLKPVSFCARKAEYIQNTSTILLAQYGGDIPSTLKELLALPGVGPKMSYLVMSSAWDNTVHSLSLLPCPLSSPLPVSTVCAATQHRLLVQALLHLSLSLPLSSLSLSLCIRWVSVWTCMWIASLCDWAGRRSLHRDVKTARRRTHERHWRAGCLLTTGCVCDRQCVTQPLLH